MADDKKDLEKELSYLPKSDGVFGRDGVPIRRKPAILQENPVVQEALEPVKSNSPEVFNPKKSTNEEMLDRRNKVLQYRLRGLSFTSIAQVLKVSISTVKKDFQEAKKDTASHIKDFDKPGFIADAVNSLDDVLARAWEEYNNIPLNNPQQRIKSLELIKNIKNDQFNMLQNAGLIERAPEKHQMFISSQILHGWSDEIKKVAIESFLGAKTVGELEAPKPDPALIEAEFEEKKPE